MGRGALSFPSMSHKCFQLQFPAGFPPDDEHLKKSNMLALLLSTLHEKCQQSDQRKITLLSKPRKLLNLITCFQNFSRSFLLALIVILLTSDTSLQGKTSVKNVSEKTGLKSKQALFAYLSILGSLGGN